jgi:hypothetical protein
VLGIAHVELCTLGLVELKEVALVPRGDGAEPDDLDVLAALVGQVLGDVRRRGTGSVPAGDLCA